MINKTNILLKPLREYPIPKYRQGLFSSLIIFIREKYIQYKINKLQNFNQNIPDLIDKLDLAKQKELF